MRRKKLEVAYRLQDWPESEQVRWRAATAPRQRARPRKQDAWAQKYWEGLLSRYGLALTWLQSNGGIDWSLPPAKRWTGTLLNRYVEHLEASYAPATVHGRISGLEGVLSIMDPEGDRTAVLNVLKTTKKALFEDCDLTDFPTCEDLVDLGLACRSQVVGSGSLNEHQFKQLRDGLMLCFVNTLLMRPKDTIALQVMSITHEQYALDLGRDYVPKELPPRLAMSDAGQWRVKYIPSKTKRFAQTEWDKEIAGEIVEYLVTYLDERTSILNRNKLDHASLWISYDGMPVGLKTLYRSLTGLTKAGGYPAIASQRSRQIAATKAAEEQPEGMVETSEKLGHLLLATTTGYNKAGSLSASQRNNALTADRMAAARARRRQG